jgi:hypothetical protein
MTFRLDVWIERHRVECSANCFFENRKLPIPKLVLLSTAGARQSGKLGRLACSHQTLPKTNERPTQWVHEKSFLPVAARWGCGEGPTD